jgi:HAD superfamily hydrolase (TIGR01458 family)
MQACLFDLDGTLYQGDAAIPGAPELIARLRRTGTPFRFVTNTTSKPRSAIVARLRRYGFVLEEHEVFTALVAGAALARAQHRDTLLPLVTPAALEDLAGFTLIGGTSQNPIPSPLPPRTTVLVGDLGARWSFDLVQQGFSALMNGGDFIALSRDRYWMSATGLTIDCGAFVTALEYASGVQAKLAGKPSPLFYQTAVRSMDLAPGTDVVMVGDDIQSDVAGAQQAGLQGFQVKTGKYREAVVAASGIIPDRIIESVADLFD